MTDTTRIADYARALDFAELPDAVVHECKPRLIDTFRYAVAWIDPLHPAGEYRSDSKNVPA